MEREPWRAFVDETKDRTLAGVYRNMLEMNFSFQQVARLTNTTYEHIKFVSDRYQIPFPFDLKEELNKLVDQLPMDACQSAFDFLKFLIEQDRDRMKIGNTDRGTVRELLKQSGVQAREDARDRDTCIVFVNDSGEVVREYPAGSKGLNAYIEKEGDHYIARCPEIDAESKGKTKEEALLMLKSALSLCLEVAAKIYAKERFYVSFTLEEEKNYDREK